MIKILFTSLTGYPNSNSGGPTRIIFDLLKNLDYSKYEPFFLSYDLFKRFSSKEDLESDQRQNISFKRKLGHKLFKNNRLYRIIVTSNLYLRFHFHKKDRYFQKVVSNIDYFDIIHCHDTLSAYYFIKNNSSKKILTIHSKGSQVNELRQVYRKSDYIISKLEEFLKREILAFDNFDIITFPSKAARELFRSDLNINSFHSDKIRIIYNGIDIETINSIQPGKILEKYHIRTESFDIILLNVAQHVEEKNIDLIIESLSILRNKYYIKALLINVGEGHLTDYYKKIIFQNSLIDYVILLGMIPNEDVIKLLKAADLFIQASEKVVFDLSVLEALTAGCQVVVSKEGGNNEIIRHGQNGYFLNYLNAFEIAEFIFNYDNNKRNRLNTRNDIFSISTMVQEYKCIYESKAV